MCMSQENLKEERQSAPILLSNILFDDNGDGDKFGETLKTECGVDVMEHVYCQMVEFFRCRAFKLVADIYKAAGWGYYIDEKKLVPAHCLMVDCYAELRDYEKADEELDYLIKYLGDYHQGVTKLDVLCVVTMARYYMCRENWEEAAKCLTQLNEYVLQCDLPKCGSIEKILKDFEHRCNDIEAFRTCIVVCKQLRAQYNQ